MKIISPISLLLTKVHKSWGIIYGAFASFLKLKSSSTYSLQLHWKKQPVVHSSHIYTKYKGLEWHEGK